MLSKFPFVYPSIALALKNMFWSGITSKTIHLQGQSHLFHSGLALPVRQAKVALFQKHFFLFLEIRSSSKAGQLISMLGFFVSLIAHVARPTISCASFHLIWTSWCEKGPYGRGCGFEISCLKVESWFFLMSWYAGYNFERLLRNIGGLHNWDSAGWLKSLDSPCFKVPSSFLLTKIRRCLANFRYFKVPL